jgi:ABC-type branched-subunit amino acid transport system ATPase component
LISSLLNGQDGIAPQMAGQIAGLRSWRAKRATPAQFAPAPTRSTGSAPPAGPNGTVVPVPEVSAPPVAEPDQRAATPPGEVLLDVTGASVRYGAVVAVNDLSLQVSRGEIVGLIGPNGAGKTSAIDVITGFTAASSGTVVLRGQPVQAWSPARRARAGLVRSFQSLELFEDLTVLDNLRAACDGRDLAAYLTDLVKPGTARLSAAAEAAIEEFGLQDVLESKVSELSFGRRRLLAIARAVASSPSVVLLDEPAAGLDENETAELAHLLRRLADRGLAVLLVEHDLNLVMSVCDRLVVLDFGNTIASGPTQEVRRAPEVIASYLGEQLGSAPAQSTPAQSAPA